MSENKIITHPGEGGHPDGLNWLTLDESAKYAYVCGFVEGLFEGHCFTTWGLPGGEPINSAYVDATRSFDDHWSRFVANRGYKQFVEGLDKLYADERNSKIEMQHGLWIVMNILSGIPDMNLEMMIEAWRQKDAER